MTTPPNTSVHPAVAVIGGTGHTGRRVVDRLRARSLDVRIDIDFDFAAHVRRVAASGAWSLDAAEETSS